MHSITKMLCSLQKQETWCKYRFSSCKKTMKPKLRQGHCDQGCSWLQGTFSSGTPPQTLIPFLSPSPTTPGRLLVGWWRLLPGTWGPGTMGPGARSIALWPKSPHWQAFSRRWEVRPLMLDMAGLSVPDNKLCLVRSAFMGSVVLLSRAMPTFLRSVSGFCGQATVLRNPPKQKGPPSWWFLTFNYLIFLSCSQEENGITSRPM